MPMLLPLSSAHHSLLRSLLPLPLGCSTLRPLQQPHTSNPPRCHHHHQHHQLPSPAPCPTPPQLQPQPPLSPLPCPCRARPPRMAPSAQWSSARPCSWRRCSARCSLRPVWALCCTSVATPAAAVGLPAVVRSLFMWGARVGCAGERTLVHTPMSNSRAARRVTPLRNSLLGG